MRKKWKKARIKNLHQLSSNVLGIDLIIEDDALFDFRPGQFVTLDLPVGEKRLDRWRSYSIVNTSNQENLVQLAISYIEGGRASEYFFNTIKENDILDLKGPEGVFSLPPILDQPLVMICTGTGVAPFKSMISDIYNKKIRHWGIHLIYGTRYQEGILYRDFFEDMQLKLTDFEYSVALSREKFKGYQGYVHELYEKHYAEPRKDITFYLCGWQYVIDEAKERLLKMGYSREQIVLELYG